LLTQKQKDYFMFKQIVKLMKKEKAHLTTEGIIKIIKIKKLLNRGLNSSLAHKIKESFPDLGLEVQKFKYISPKQINLY
jgi:hypothetical protein